MSEKISRYARNDPGWVLELTCGGYSEQPVANICNVLLWIFETACGEYLQRPVADIQNSLWWIFGMDFE